jgi:hypothetical protein
MHHITAAKSAYRDNIDGSHIMALNLERHQGQWVDITHPKSGDVLKIRVAHIYAANGHPSPMVTLSFFDDPKNFHIVRPGVNDGKKATQPEVGS